MSRRYRFFGLKADSITQNRESYNKKRMPMSIDGPKRHLSDRNPSRIEPVVSVSTATQPGETANGTRAKNSKKNTSPKDTNMGISPTFLAATACVFSVFYLNPAVGAAPPIEVGQPFPDLVLPALNGDEPMRISDFRPKPVVLHIFASW